MFDMFKKLVIELVWPIMKDVIKKLLREVVNWLVMEVKKRLKKRTEEQGKSATARADAEEDKARYAKTKEEAARHEAMANVWREVAEMLRRDNEGLEKELEELRRNAERKTEEAADSMKFEDAVDTSGEEIKAIDDDRPMLNLSGPTSK